MSGKEKGSSRKSDLLDRLFCKNKRLSIGVPMAIAVGTYVLYLIFGDIHAADDARYSPLLMGLFAFVGSFLVLGFQLLNPWCSPKAMDNAELFFALYCAGIGSVWMLLYGFWQLFGGDAQGTAKIVAEFVGVWCGICVVHNMRK